MQVNVSFFGLSNFLGCGLDSYAWRIDLPQHFAYFELDLPQMLEYKSKTLAKFPLVVNYKPIPVNLKEENWQQKLLENGFDGNFY